MNAPRRIVPEVVQTSMMDCGPATLKAILEGFGISVSYGRLREACQTDVDGTSIDVMEQVAGQLGLDAEQRMLATDHVFEPASAALPAIAVVSLPSGVTHFVVVWSRVGGFVQLMDPAIGRRWMSADVFLSSLYQHVQLVPAADWREFAGGEAFVETVRSRLRRLGMSASRIETLTREALADPGWRSLAALDAATRATAGLVRAGAFRRGAEAERLLVATLQDAERLDESAWPVRPGKPDADGAERLKLRGAVLVTMKGRKSAAEVRELAVGLSPELAAALGEPPSRPLLHVIRLLREDGWFGAAIILLGLTVTTAGGLLQTLLLRGMLDAGRLLGTVPQRLGATAALLALILVLVAMEWPIAASAQRMGRALETRLRIAFLEKVPRLGDRYFTSRPATDMAERNHSSHALRTLPEAITALLWALFRMGALTTALVVLDPAGALWTLSAAIIGVGAPLLLQWPLQELDMRMRTHAGALSRYYLDALLGLVALRTHGAERSLRRAYEELLGDWKRSAREQSWIVAAATAGQGLISSALSAVLFVGFLVRHPDPTTALLVLYLALELPVLGIQIALSCRSLPALRNITLRMLEPLGALEDGDVRAEMGTEEASGAVALSLRDVTVVAGGHPILTEVTLEIAPREHVAIVGPSGAGKSSFVGLLLGWHRAAAGEVRVDGAPLDAAHLARLRARTAWVDPAVTIWNQTLFDNLAYGSDAPPSEVGRRVAEADLLGGGIL